METPCVNICVIDQTTRLCAGCHRSIDEIAGWRGYTDAERRRIMSDLPARARAAKSALAPAQAGQ